MNEALHEIGDLPCDEDVAESIITYEDEYEYIGAID